MLAVAPQAQVEVLRAQAANPRQRKCQDHMQIAEQRLGFVAA